MEVYGFVGGVYLLHLYCPQFLNEIADDAVKYYSLAAVVIIVVAFLRSASSNDESSEDRDYKIAGKNDSKDNEECTPESFAGTWDKIERPGFKEFAIFMGHPSFMAGLAEKQAFSNEIQVKEENGKKYIKIDMTGVPSQPGSWCEIGSDESVAAVETKGVDGSMLQEKVWWNADDKKLFRTLEHSESNPKGVLSKQVREISPDGKMYIAASAQKISDKSRASFTVILKRK